MSLMSASMPDISRHFLDKVKKTFPPLRPVPNVTTIDELMHNAGMQELIEWMEVQATKEMIVVGGE